MDASRNADLSNLHRLFSDPTKPKHVRAWAFEGYQKIQAQVKDKTLTGLRLRLIRAARASDTDAAKRIEQHVIVHSRRMGYTHH